MPLKTEAWEHYWESNATLNSFAFDYSANEGPYKIINEFWVRAFEEFTSSDTIVDLGAGNGALMHLFLQRKGLQNIEKWLNIDSAKAVARIEHSTVIYQQDDMCKLSLSDNSVNQFVSMFGLEYGDFAKTIPHLYRCLRLGGKFHIILHHQDSIVSKQSQLTINVMKKVLASNLLNNLTHFVSIDRLKTHLLSGLNQTLQSVEGHAIDDVKIIGKGIYNIIQSSNDLSIKVDMLLSLKKDMLWQVERLQQQLAGAQQVNLLSTFLHDNGFNEFCMSPLSYDNEILCWSLTGIKV
ncbi:class I SAM-dependent methyltransferase [uncultured Paraglaciecola sp.]|uniref:class I SAM-dependent methyltransferase n=1 Tax=uncultured Paraglaciecola sp. TaxID=1765024 RepID=UPI00262511F4|nr:class I SAM-dependent methyltransferase [uncultured Paraglaciecola sp.]